MNEKAPQKAQVYNAYLFYKNCHSKSFLHYPHPLCVCVCVSMKDKEREKQKGTTDRGDGTVILVLEDFINVIKI